MPRKSHWSKIETIHDTDNKLYEKFKLTTDRKNLTYRNWFAGKMKKESNEHDLKFNEDSFVNQYFVRIDPKQQNSSM